MRPDHHNSPFESVTFDWQELSNNAWVSGELLRDMPRGIVDAELSVEQAAMRRAADDMIVRLRAWVLKYKLPGHTVNKRLTVHWEVPATWWDHFKADHADSWWLGWLVRWRPAQMQQRCRSVRFRAAWEDMALYPWQTFAPSHRNLGRPVRHVEVHVSNDTEPWWRP